MRLRLEAGSDEPPARDIRSTQSLRGWAWAPPSRSRSQISMTAASGAGAGEEDVDRARPDRRRQDGSGSARHPPVAAMATTRFCRLRCSMSRGRSAPGTDSKKAASCSPTAAPQAAQVSTPVSEPRPPSSLAISGCETPARAATSRCGRPAAVRASRESNAQPLRHVRGARSASHLDARGTGPGSGPCRLPAHARQSRRRGSSRAYGQPDHRSCYPCARRGPRAPGLGDAGLIITPRDGRGCSRGSGRRLDREVDDSGRG